jgi:cyclin C
MSSDFYASTHSKYWLLTRDELATSREVDLKYATPHQLYCLNIFFASLIQKLGKRLLLRQVPIATATVYFRRFYTKNSVCETNPYLVLAACVFVAAKVEETPVHIKSVVAEAKVVFAGKRSESEAC